MSLSTEQIREQIAATRARLDEKLYELENRIADPFEFSRTAMGATASSLRRTLKTVTAQVQQNVRASSDNFEILQQVKRHPWLTAGGAAVLGYLISGLFCRRDSSLSRANRITPDSSTINPSSTLEDTLLLSETASPVIASEKRNHEQLIWSQLKSIAIRTLGKLAEESACRAVPVVLDNLTRHEHQPASSNCDQANEPKKECVDCGHIAWAERAIERGQR